MDAGMVLLCDHLEIAGKPWQEGATKEQNITNYCRVLFAGPDHGRRSALTGARWRHDSSTPIIEIISI